MGQRGAAEWARLQQVLDSGELEGEVVLEAEEQLQVGEVPATEVHASGAREAVCSPGAVG